MRCRSHKVLAPVNSYFQVLTPFHKKIQVDQTGSFQVHGQCESVAKMQTRDWMVLPPIQEHYWRKYHNEYQALPPWRPDCVAGLATLADDTPMDIIYPLEGAKVYIPTELDGKQGRVVFRASHRKDTAKIFWHVDEQFVSETSVFHTIELALDAGWHKLILVDELGFRMERWFKVLEPSD